MASRVNRVRQTSRTIEPPDSRDTATQEGRQEPALLGSDVTRVCSFTLSRTWSEWKKATTHAPAETGNR